MKRKLVLRPTPCRTSSGRWSRMLIVSTTTTIHSTILFILVITTGITDAFSPNPIVVRNIYHRRCRNFRYRRQNDDGRPSTSLFVLKEPEEVLITDDIFNNTDGNDEEGYLIINKSNGERRYVTKSKQQRQQQQSHQSRTNDRNDSSVSSFQERRMNSFLPATATATSSVVQLDRNNPEYRYSVSDWLPIMCRIFQSSTLKYTRGPVIAIMIWSAVLSTIQSIMEHFHSTFIQHIYTLLPSTIAHTTTVSVLGLLLVFRTTSAYQKFDEGRLIWERILGLCRNVTRQILLYPEFTCNKKIRIVQLLASYPYFLYQHIKAPTAERKKNRSEKNKRIPGATNSSWNYNTRIRRWWKKSEHPRESISSSKKHSTGNDVQQQTSQQRKIISNELPWSLFIHDKNSDNSSFNRSIIQRLMKSENRPLYILDKIGEEITQVPYTSTFSSMERTVLLTFLNELTEAISECERIHRTTVPLNYARHSLRGLTVWLFTLPITLLESYQWWTAPIMGLTAWLYYGIYQIGYSIEDPFQSSIRLTSICNAIYRDVICDEHRSSAFDISLSGDDDGEWKDLPL